MSEWCPYMNTDAKVADANLKGGGSIRVVRLKPLTKGTPKPNEPCGVKQLLTPINVKSAGRLDGACKKCWTTVTIQVYK